MSDLKNRLMRFTRGLQTRVPALLEAKFALQYTWRGMMRRPFMAEFRLLEQFDLASGEQILDIGANRGQSIQAIRMFEATAPVIAFEANPVLADRLKGRFQKDRHLTVEAFGLGTEETRGTLYLPYYRQWMFDGLASFDREAAVSWLNEKRMPGFRKELMTVKEVESTIRRLDDLELSPGFIKIDVQGFENAVIMGGQETITRHRPAFLIEYEPGQEFPFLTSLGYGTYFYDKGRLIATQGTRRTPNLFYITPDRLDALKRRGVMVSEDNSTLVTPRA